MNHIILQKLELINFKGIKSLKLDFEESTNIFGDNGTGKTTVFDAFTWLLFGKDSADRKDYLIKTFDKHNVVIPKIEHEVSAIIVVDGEQISIKRVFKEKWVKQRGALEAEFTGNETLYYYNEVPLSQKEFGNKISQILDEQVFKLITSPLAFNSLKWQDQRNVLVQIVGIVSDKDLAAGNPDYENLVSQLSNKSLDEYKKQIANTIKKAKDDIKAIPTRIDEVERNKPESVNEKEIQLEIAAKNKEIDTIDNQLQDKSAAYDEVIKKRNANQDEIFNLKSQTNSIEFDAREKAKLSQKSETSKADLLKSELAEIQAESKSADAKRDTLAQKKENIISQIANLNAIIENTRSKWNEVNAKELTFNENEFCCPTCKREFEASDVESKEVELKNNFITDKQNQLKTISENGKSKAAEKSNLETELKTLNERIIKGTDYIIQLGGKIEELQLNISKAVDQESSVVLPSLESVTSKLLSENSEYQNLVSKISELQSLKFEIASDDNAELKTKKSALSSDIKELHSQLQTNEQIKLADLRIQDLMNEESKLAQEIANIEKTQYLIDNFTKLKIDTIEGKINEKFSYVKFKLFDLQINGAEVETCEALINGVPFSGANTASKINAGVDIINTLSEFYQVSAPIFIDNRESVVNLIESKSQIINLIVSAADKKLRIA